MLFRFFVFRPLRLRYWTFRLHSWLEDTQLLDKGEAILCKGPWVSKFHDRVFQFPVSVSKLKFVCSHSYCNSHAWFSQFDSNTLYLLDYPQVKIIVTLDVPITLLYKCALALRCSDLLVCKSPLSITTVYVLKNYNCWTAFIQTGCHVILCSWKLM